MNLRYRVKKKITFAPFPFILLISCAIGLIFLISENVKIHNFDVISHGNKIYQGNQLIGLNHPFFNDKAISRCPLNVKFFICFRYSW